MADARMRSEFASTRFSASSFASSSGLQVRAGNFFALEVPQIEQPQPVLLIALQVGNAVANVVPRGESLRDRRKIRSGKAVEQRQPRGRIERQHRFVLRVNDGQMRRQLLVAPSPSPADC